MSSMWVKIYTSNDFFKSELVRQILVENEIDAVIIDKRGYPYNLGEVEVHIQQDNFQKALEIIISNEL